VQTRDQMQHHLAFFIMKFVSGHRIKISFHAPVT
jgi:hypothetical protein